LSSAANPDKSASILTGKPRGQLQDKAIALGRGQRLTRARRRAFPIPRHFLLAQEMTGKNGGSGEGAG
jgi:hypothetical protein